MKPKSFTKFIEESEPIETTGEVLIPRDIFYSKEKKNIIYIAYKGKDGNTRKRVVRSSKGKNIGKTSKISPKEIFMLIDETPPMNIVSSLEKGNNFIITGNGSAQYLPVAKVHRTSNTPKWEIELLHCKEKFTKINKSNYVIPL